MKNLLKIKKIKINKHKNIGDQYQTHDKKLHLIKHRQVILIMKKIPNKYIKVNTTSCTTWITNCYITSFTTS